LLCKQNVLRNFDQEQIDSITAADEGGFQLQTRRDLRCVAYDSFGEPGICR
jgi:hypothetical protein